MERPETERSEERVLQPAPHVDEDRIPADAERTIEREEERGVPRADHNTSSEGAGGQEKEGR